MMHDPFQTHSLWGGYPGITGGLNPLALNPLSTGISGFGQHLGAQGIPGYGGIHPQHLQQLQQLHQQAQQLQLASLLGSQGIVPQGLGVSPLMTGLHNPMMTMGWQNPLTAIALQNPFAAIALQNPLAAIGLQNPILSQQNPLYSQGLQNPLLNPILAQYYQSQYPQIGYGGVTQFGQGSPFGQIGYPLAPQSWIGPQGVAGGTPFGQTNPLLSQLTGRGFQGHGISPWSAF